MSERGDTTGELLRRAQPRSAAALRRVDPLLLGAVLLLVAVGLVFVYSASAVRQQAAVGDEFHHLTRQLLAIGLGLDYLAVNRTCSVDTIPHIFGLMPARFSTRLDYLKGQHWTRQALRRLFIRRE